MTQFTHALGKWHKARGGKVQVVPSSLQIHLVAEAMKLTKARSKREAVDLALRELVNRRRRRNVLDLVGQDLIARDYDVRAVRAGMNRGSRR